MFKNKKIKKVLSVLIVFVFSLFVFPFGISAEVVEGDDKVYPFDLEWLQVDFIKSDGTIVPVSVSVDGNEVNSGRVRCSIRRTDGKSFKATEKYKILLTMKIDIADEHTLNYYSGDYCVSASYRLSISSTAAINVTANNYAARSDINYSRTTEDGRYTYDAYNVVTVNYPYSDIGDKYVYYYNQFQCTFNSNVNLLTLNVYQVEFTAITEAEKFLGNKIDSATNEIVTNQDENTSEIISNQDENTSKITSNQDENTSKITSNQDKNTQAIIDNEKELQENEKTEANNTGNDGVNDVTSAIPDESSGFVSAINNFVSSMSYNGTECNLAIPTVKIPSINGIIKETVLIDNAEIPFEFWIGKIPSSLLLLVQSILTVALIVFCFKELYSVISYVLTLRGGNSNE